MSYRPKKQDMCLITESKFRRVLANSKHELVELKMTDYALAKFNFPMMPTVRRIAYLSNGYYYIEIPDLRYLRVKAYGKPGIHNPWRENRNSRNWKAIRQEQVQEYLDLGYLIGSVKHYRETKAYINVQTVHQN